jgi:CHASE2 domain-containing sensor protein
MSRDDDRPGWIPEWLPVSVRRLGPKSRLTPRRYRAALLVAVWAGAVLLSLLAAATGALNGLEGQTVDARFSVRGAERPDARIAIVAIDDRTEEALNVAPPIPRVFMAQLLDRLHAAKPRLIVLDYQFKGASRRPADDRALVAAFSRDGPILMGAPDPPNGEFLPAGLPPGAGEVLASLAVDNNPDAVIRQLLYVQVQRKTLAVRAGELLAARGVSPASFPGNHAWIDFRGPPGTFPMYSMIDVRRGDIPLGAFAGKVVLVGATDPLVKDVFVTAASSTPMAGVELQANALSTILSGFPLRSVSGVVNVLVLLALAAVPPLLSWRFPSLQVLAGTVLVLFGYLIAVQLAFDSGRIVSMINPMIGLVFATAGSIAVETLVERRRRQALESALQGVLRPARTGFFISYRRTDADWAASALCNALVERFGKSSVFMDTRTIRPGQEWPAEIHEAILGASVMLVLIGHHWLDERDSTGRPRLEDPADWVRLEIEAGLRRAELVVVPVLLGGARFPAEESLPETIRGLAHRNAIAISADDLDAEIDRLVDLIEVGRLRELFAPGRAAPVLRMISQPARRFMINSDMVIGSAPGADIRLEGDDVAEWHAQVWPAGEGLGVKDLGTPGGTWVDGERIVSLANVGDKSEIKLGRATFVVELDGSSPAVQPIEAPEGDASRLPA